MKFVGLLCMHFALGCYQMVTFHVPPSGTRTKKFFPPLFFFSIFWAFWFVNFCFGCQKFPVVMEYVMICLQFLVEIHSHWAISAVQARVHRALSSFSLFLVLCPNASHSQAFFFRKFKHSISLCFCPKSPFHFTSCSNVWSCWRLKWYS